MKKILIKHGIIALVLGILWVISYLYTESIHGGLDSIAEAIFGSVMFLIVTGAFLLNVVLTLTDTIIHFAPQKGKIILSWILLACYAAALLFIIYDAFAFSYGKFFSYLAEGEFFSILHVFFFVVLIIMILIRAGKLRKIAAQK